MEENGKRQQKTKKARIVDGITATSTTKFRKLRKDKVDQLNEFKESENSKKFEWVQPNPLVQRILSQEWDHRKQIKEKEAFQVHDNHLIALSYVPSCQLVSFSDKEVEKDVNDLEDIDADIYVDSLQS